MFNSIHLYGNIATEIKTLDTEKSKVASFSIGHNSKYKTKSGEYKEEVSFFVVKCWGKTAEFMSENAEKGARVILAGKLSQERWETDGKKFSRVVINASTIYLLDKKKRETKAEETAIEESPTTPDNELPF